jgi:predicted RNase H-like nuclease
LGYRLAVTPPVGPAIAEVYPHPALIAYLGRTYRLPYKLSRAHLYWRELPPAGRRERLLAVWRDVLVALERRMAGVALMLSPPDEEAPLKIWKAFEDQLDAIVCAAVGIDILEGRAEAYGDANSAIWVPRPGPSPT